MGKMRSDQGSWLWVEVSWVGLRMARGTCPLQLRCVVSEKKKKDSGEHPQKGTNENVPLPLVHFSNFDTAALIHPVRISRNSICKASSLFTFF